MQSDLEAQNMQLAQEAAEANEALEKLEGHKAEIERQLAEQEAAAAAEKA